MFFESDFEIDANEDSDVKQERLRVEELLKNEKSNEEAIVVINLTKFYDGF